MDIMVCDQLSCRGRCFKTDPTSGCDCALSCKIYGTCCIDFEEECEGGMQIATSKDAFVLLSRRSSPPYRRFYVLELNQNGASPVNFMPRRPNADNSLVRATVNRRQLSDDSRYVGVTYALSHTCFRMIGNCKKGYHHLLTHHELFLCRVEDTENNANIYHRIPVIAGGLLFKNKFCALCNGFNQSNIVSWKSWRFCGKDMKIMGDVRDVTTDNGTTTCMVIVERPSLDVWKNMSNTHSCPALIDECDRPRIGRDVESFYCGRYSSVVKSEDGVMYKNVNCAKCNGLNISEVSCTLDAPLPSRAVHVVVHGVLTTSPIITNRDITRGNEDKDVVMTPSTVDPENHEQITVLNEGEDAVVSTTSTDLENNGNTIDTFCMMITLCFCLVPCSWYIKLIM